MKRILKRGEEVWYRDNKGGGWGVIDFITEDAFTAYACSPKDRVVISTKLDTIYCAAKDVYQVVPGGYFEGNKIVFVHDDNCGYPYYCPSYDAYVEQDDVQSLLECTFDEIDNCSREIRDAEDETIAMLKKVLAPCGEEGVSFDEDFCEDIYYPYAEPSPNYIVRIKAIRYNKEHDALQVQIAESHSEIKNTDFVTGDWIEFSKAHVADIGFLLDEVRSSIEYANGYAVC